jgi:predicted ATP-grasp superfamily ATP-dependent carboligase
VTEWQEGLVRDAMRILDALAWRGIASIEFKVARDGAPYFIELNPRLPWYNHLFLAAGINFPALIVEDLCGSSRSPAPVTQREGVAWAYLANDWASHRRSEPAPGLRDWWRWLRQHAAARATAWKNWSDPRPWIAAYAPVLGGALRRLGRRFKRG